jgi:hypothetical protein
MPPNTGQKQDNYREIDRVKYKIGLGKQAGIVRIHHYFLFGVVMVRCFF